MVLLRAVAADGADDRALLKRFDIYGPPTTICRAATGRSASATAS